ncbi:MAG: hypothetical protein IKC37_04950 [Clostridia bacterium]|nr:hypothetical protein [Clostridia bacterium]
MKKKIISLIATLSVAASALALSACFPSDPPTIPDYNADVEVVSPEDITQDSEHFVVEEDTTYYTSPGFFMMMEVNGAFFEMKYFSLDGNKRVYDNLYFYQNDYFFIVTDDYRDLYASLGDPSDTQYAEEEKEQGYDIQINIKRAGIYKVVFDTDTLKFDMEYKAEITTPKYYTIKNCQVYSQATEWVDMSVNPDNEEEFVIENFYVAADKFISFFDRTHTSNYKVILDESCLNTYASLYKAIVTVNVGGYYDIYINAKTYLVRLVLRDPDTATYSCVYYDGSEFITLSPVDEAVPYIFRQRIVVEDKYDHVPNFHTTKFETYDLTVEDSEFLLTTQYGPVFRNVGTYDLIINLKTFTISVELTPQ